MTRALGQLEADVILQDDTARPHRARIIENFLQAHGVEPAVSPDLNPIENLWDQLGRTARKRVTSATTLAQLRQILIQEWNAIPQDRVRRLVSSMGRRRQAVKWEHTGVQLATKSKLKAVTCFAYCQSVFLFMS